jgi:hypothetical protein
MQISVYLFARSRYRSDRINQKTTMKPIAIAILILFTLGLAQAEPRERKNEKREHHNYIIERQSAGQVSGVPILRRIRGGREIDIYRDGSMFEKNNFVGYDKR